MANVSNVCEDRTTRRDWLIGTVSYTCSRALSRENAEVAKQEDLMSCVSGNLIYRPHVFVSGLLKIDISRA